MICLVNTIFKGLEKKYPDIAKNWTKVSVIYVEYLSFNNYKSLLPRSVMLKNIYYLEVHLMATLAKY